MGTPGAASHRKRSIGLAVYEPFWRCTSRKSHQTLALVLTHAGNQPAHLRAGGYAAGAEPVRSGTIHRGSLREPAQRYGPGHCPGKLTAEDYSPAADCQKTPRRCRRGRSPSDFHSCKPALPADGWLFERKASRFATAVFPQGKTTPCWVVDFACKINSLQIRATSG